jgi:excisionase family DNA binding protein
MRSFTIPEAAEVTGLTQRALHARIEEGHLRAVVREGTAPRIPESELRRAGLLPALEQRSAERSHGPPQAPGSDIVRELVAVIERQAAELAELRARGLE